MKLSKQIPAGSKGQSIPSTALKDYPLKPDEDYQAEIRRQKAEEALHTLSRAEEHRKDRGLMRDVKKLAKKKMNHYSNLCK